MMTLYQMLNALPSSCGSTGASAVTSKAYSTPGAPGRAFSGASIARNIQSEFRKEKDKTNTLPVARWAYRTCRWQNNT